MPRNGSDVYSLPSGSTVADGDTISPSQHNSPLNDIAEDLNAARPIKYGGTGAQAEDSARDNLSVSAHFETTAVAENASTGQTGAAAFIFAGKTLYKQTASATALVAGDTRTFEYAGGVIDADTTVTIPTDYSTLQAAFDALSHTVRTRDTTITVQIETGHDLTAGLSLNGGDYRDIVISSVDATVSLDAGFTSVDGTAVDANYTAVVVVGVNCLMPVFNVKIDVNDDTIAGLVTIGCTVTGESGAGFINGYRNGEVRAGEICWRSGVWSGAFEHGLRLTSGTKFDIGGSTISGCWRDDSDDDVSYTALHISRGSSGNAQDLTMDSNGYTHVGVRRSFAYLGDGTFTNRNQNGAGASRDLYLLQGAHVSAPNCTSEGGALEAGDCHNVDFFNVPTEHGTVYDPDSDKLLESDSDSNGEYVKFADGTMIAWGSVNLGSATSAGSGTRASPYRTPTNGQTITFPEAFISAPNVTFSNEAGGTATFLARVFTPSHSTITTTQVNTYRAVRMTDNNDASDVTVHWKATGKWK